MASQSRSTERCQSTRLVERRTPVTEPARTRRVSYRIADSFLASYLGTLTRFRAEIERGLGSSILPVLMRSLDDHQGPGWEEALRPHVRRLAADGQLGDDIVGVGGWWSDDGTHEVDVVAVAGNPAPRSWSARRSGHADRTPPDS